MNHAAMSLVACFNWLIKTGNNSKTFYAMVTTVSHACVFHVRVDVQALLPLCLPKNYSGAMIHELYIKKTKC